MSSKKKTFKVSLMGGCGNQLFQLFSGIYFAALKDSQLEVSLDRVLNNRHQGFCINKSSYLSNLSCLHFVSHENSYLAKARLSIWNRNHFRARGFGYPTNEINLPKVNSIEGYFQTFFYFDKLIRMGILKLDLLYDDFYKIFKESNKHITDVENALVIHMRMGDYYGQKDSLGVLSTRYFSEVLNSSHNEGQRIYVISDEPLEIVNNRINSLFDFEYLDTSELHPLGIISLISQFKAILLSNSSLSWWGGKLQKSGRVYAPEPWFRGLESPELFLPHEWLRYESKWEE